MHELSSQANPLKISVLGYRLFGANMVLKAKKKLHYIQNHAGD